MSPPTLVNPPPTPTHKNDRSPPINRVFSSVSFSGVYLLSQGWKKQWYQVLYHANKTWLIWGGAIFAQNFWNWHWNVGKLSLNSQVLFIPDSGFLFTVFWIFICFNITSSCVHLFLICGKKIGGSLFCGKIICGSPHLWEEKAVGEDKNVGWEEAFSSPPNLPPTPHFSPLPHFFPPTFELNHKKLSHKIGSHPTKWRKGLGITKDSRKI